MEISTSVGEGCYFDFLLLKMFIIAAPNTTHFRNDHPRTSSSHSHGPLPSVLETAQPKFVAPLSPARKFNSLHLRRDQQRNGYKSQALGRGATWRSTSWNLIQKERMWPVSPGWIWWHSGGIRCVFYFHISGLKRCLTATMPCAASAWGSTKNSMVLFHGWFLDTRSSPVQCVNTPKIAFVRGGSTDNRNGRERRFPKRAQNSRKSKQSA